MADYLQDHLAMGCAGALAMPNTQPPVSRVLGVKEDHSWSIETYMKELQSAGASAFEQLIVPLYLTKQTTAEMIREGVVSGKLKACKSYPPHGTTNSEHGLSMEKLIGSEVLSTMEELGVVLCIHGEQHGLSGSDYIDAVHNAETRFYTEWMPRLLDAHPKLRIVCEHITTRKAAEFVKQAPEHVGATVTPQHLLYTLGHLIQGLKYHLYCLPVVKFQEDREALRSVVTEIGQKKFFAGTDSAPHTTKATDCGCAAGCYTGGCAPQLYAMAFEEAGVDLASEAGKESFERFLSLNGPAFYGFEASKQTFVMEKTPSTTQILQTASGSVTPLPSGLGLELTWSIISKA